MVNLDKNGSNGTDSRPPRFLLGSRFYGKSRTRAADYIRSRDKLTGLIDTASVKAHGKKSGLRNVWTSTLAFFRLIRAYVNGSYRQVSPQALLTIVAAIVYFVSPIDLIPDFIIGLGLIDDATILAWTIKACASDLASFIDWERSQGTSKQ
ncbi:DUF1232 domain-containing protein [Massilia sp. PAMC28688]|uniref:YkvA family protein n=1 Tax=Massilia sp. PAMC28688 TaxID=2861283 RepID=UPI001C635E8E|nr:YkvA family protein [Massilia sp. PAMC28688]QYF92974.1 DUF1232 domain-containing protein [Massilia sp. PAMC28688]